MLFISVALRNRNSNYDTHTHTRILLILRFHKTNSVMTYYTSSQNASYIRCNRTSFRLQLSNQIPNTCVCCTHSRKLIFFLSVKPSDVSTVALILIIGLGDEGKWKWDDDDDDDDDDDELAKLLCKQ